MLFIKGKTCGVIETKREGKGLSDAAVESEWYAARKLKDSDAGSSKTVAAVTKVYRPAKFAKVKSALSDKAREVTYKSDLPIETFEIIIIDKCRRSIYNLWLQVPDYFDALVIGLTAKPAKKTIGFFNQNLVSEYTQKKPVTSLKFQDLAEAQRAKADPSRNRRNRLVLTPVQRTPAFKAPAFPRTSTGQWMRGTRKVSLTEALNNTFRRTSEDCRMNISIDPKALVFAKDDDHTDRIVDAVREVFGEGNESCKKIAYKVGKKTAEDNISSFRSNSAMRIAVTVDMISTGMDIKPLECLIFMRDVQSHAYYEQMKGQVTRICKKLTTLKMISNVAR